MMLAVEKPGHWPAMQRFDFLVRTRALTAAESTAFRHKKQTDEAPSLSPQRMAVLSALRRLTGLDAGTAAAAWRLAVSEGRRDSEK